jgi:Cd2+/Zn2+-exporting ATPase
MTPRLPLPVHPTDANPGPARTLPAGTSPRTATTSFLVDGLCCSSEARQIEAKLAGVPGIGGLSFDPVRHLVKVEGPVQPVRIQAAIAEIGMKARIVGRQEPPPTWWEQHGRTLLTVCSGVLWLGSILADGTPASRPVVLALAVAAVITGGWHVFPRAGIAIRHAALDMNFLMSAAAMGALAIGAYEEAGSLMFLFSLAQLLERRSLERARNAIRGLMELAPSEATVLRGGREIRVEPEAIGVGEVVIVRPGERIPVDGVIISGASSVIQATITGESTPVEKEAGDEVFAGTLNGEGALEIGTSRLAMDTTLARIIHSVEEAQATRAPHQAFVDRFARIYTPIVVGSAVLAALAAPLLGLGSWGDWTYRALVLLVVACPCALVISTPVTVVSALAGAARRGILIKGGLHLENAGRVRAIAFDKTGTLTSGQPEVVDIISVDGVGADELLSLAASVESRSEHPLAGAVVRHAESQGIALEPVQQVTAVPGRGVHGRVNGTHVYVGNTRLFEEMGALDRRARGLVDDLTAAGRTVILVGTRHATEAGAARLLGVIAMADAPRPEARNALAELHSAGIRHVAMLTGDSKGAASAVADALTLDGRGLDDVRAELLPEDKIEAVRELRRDHGSVLMVGDGVNDAPALASADVGVAMGAAGSDVAIETADIALMSDDLGKLATLVCLARKAERIIRANIAFSLAIKVVFVSLALLGYATLWMAVVADMGASLLVVTNGLRAMRV